MISWDVKFSGDTTGVDLNTMKAEVQRAGQEWGKYFTGPPSSNVQMNVEIIADSSIPESIVSSIPSIPIRIDIKNGKLIEKAKADYKLNTGVDLNPLAPDIIIHINPTWWLGSVEHDLTTNRSTPISLSSSKFNGELLVPYTDGVSVFMHEIGHALAFNGKGTNSTLLAVSLAKARLTNISSSKGVLTGHMRRQFMAIQFP